MTAFLEFNEACSDQISLHDCVISNFPGFTHVFRDSELKKASITAMAALLLTTLIYVSQHYGIIKLMSLLCFSSL